MIEILVVLGFPVAGALVLAAIGHRDQALTVNIVVCLATFLSAAALTVRVVSHGPLLVLDRLFFVDSFNVFLVALTAFVGFATSIQYTVASPTVPTRMPARAGPATAPTWMRICHNE